MTASFAGRFGRWDPTGLRPLTARVGAPGSRLAVGHRVAAHRGLDAGVARVVGRPAIDPDHAGRTPGAAA